MNIRVVALAFSIVTLFPAIQSEAAEEAGPPVTEQTKAEAVYTECLEQAKTRLQVVRCRMPLAIKASGANAQLVQSTIEVYDYLIESTRITQDHVHEFARRINSNLAAFEEQSSVCTKTSVAKGADPEKVLSELRRITGAMLSSSYSDRLLQNRNLGRQMEQRLPLLIDDSLKLCDHYALSNFLVEMRIVRDRFIRAKRFRVGLGASLTYLPGIEFQGNRDVDFSILRSGEFMNGELQQSVDFEFDFSNRSVTALVLSARVPYVQVDLGIPTFDKTETTIGAVESLETGGTEVLVRTISKSELNVKYDVNVKFSVLDIADGLAGLRKENGYGLYREREWLKYIDIDLGVGFTGLHFSNRFEFELKDRSDSTFSFDDLPSGDSDVLRDANSYNVAYAVLGATIRISDEFHVGLDARLYENERKGMFSLSSDNFTVALRATYYPTLPSTWRDVIPWTKKKEEKIKDKQPTKS